MFTAYGRGHAMLDILLTYQSKLRRVFFQGSIYVLLCTMLLTVARMYFVGDWQSVAKVSVYMVGLAVLLGALRGLRRNETAVPAQKVGVATMLLMAALYVAITPHALFVIGVLMLATILFFAELSTESTLRCHWLVVTLALYLVALTLRQ
ncbi:MAG: hypothetical protein KDE31_30410, partial [Caldilineaceae bacterium]|nr:hypothetical protein [Caldilineaceae bacterium]